MPTLKKVSKSRFFYQFGMETVPEAFRTGPDRTGPDRTDPIFKKAHPVGGFLKIPTHVETKKPA